MAEMDGKCCIVTGGAGSLGRASAALLLREGARVMLVDRAESDLQAAADALAGPAAGPDSGPDVIFANAGVDGATAPIADYSEAVVREVLAVNVLGRHGKAEEVAELALRLASDRASFSTEGVFTIDGGMYV